MAKMLFIASSEAVQCLSSAPLCCTCSKSEFEAWICLWSCLLAWELQDIIINIGKTFTRFQYNKLEIKTFGLVSRIQDMGLNKTIS